MGKFIMLRIYGGNKNIYTFMELGVEVRRLIGMI